LSNHQTDLTLYTAHFIDELVRAGVEHAVISPGSRSTPMALLMAEHPSLKTHIVIDERSAGFLALGLAKAAQKPVALLCTSGTAAANYYPAVVEAHYARVPLVVLTSDRPHELREVGAPQAINQTELYGSHVKWFTDMALPDSSPAMIRYVRSSAARAVQTSMHAPTGPVHLNFPFREPLIPDYDGIFDRMERVNQAIGIYTGRLELPDSFFASLAAELNRTEKGLIVCGELTDSGAEGVLALAETLGFPIVADPLSQLRSSKRLSPYVLDSYDAFLRNERLREAAAPDVVLRFGTMPVSKALSLFLKAHPESSHLVVDSGAGWRDPISTADRMIACDEEVFCREIAKQIEDKRPVSSWLSAWQKMNERTRVIMASVEKEENLDEGKLFVELQRLLPVGAAIFVGNSMPIRDLDSFFFNDEKEIKVFANRGANGIDGLVSTALGVSIAEGEVVLVLGDLSLFHDLNGLLAAKLNGLNMTVIVINNNGGGIFSYLPQAKHEKHFELLFGTPADLDFSHAAKLYGGKYQRVEDWEQFRQAFTNRSSSDGLYMIEIPTDRQQNVKVHRELWNRVSEEIDTLIGGELF